MNILSIKENVNLLVMGLDWDRADECQAMAAPVIMSGKRLGTLFIYRYGRQFTIDDIILAEYGTTVIGLAMQSAESEEFSEEHRKEMDIKAAVKTLSRLEAQAMVYVLDELGGARDGVLVTSRLADKVGITRSVIVNALKKCEEAIEELEQRNTQIDLLMASPEVCTDVARLQELTKEKETNETTLNELYEKWEQLSE